MRTYLHLHIQIYFLYCPLNWGTEITTAIGNEPGGIIIFKKHMQTSKINRFQSSWVFFLISMPSIPDWKCKESASFLLQ